MKDFILWHKKTFVVLLVIVVVIVGTALHMYIARPQLSRLPGPTLRVYFWLNGITLPLNISSADIKKELAKYEENLAYPYTSYVPEELCNFRQIIADYYGWAYPCHCGKHRAD